MDKKFIFNSLLLLIPITVFSITLINYTFFYVLTGDLFYHISNQGQLPYPPATNWLFNALNFIDRHDSAIYILLISGIWLPYILIFNHTHSIITAGIYLYLTGIPLTLVGFGLIPQSIIQLFMLISINNPYFLIFFLIFGQFVHEQALMAFLLTCVYLGVRHGFIKF